MTDENQFDRICDIASELGFERKAESDDPSDALELLWLHPSQIVIDRTYQRRVSASGKSRIKRALKDFDWRRFGAISVVPVGDNLYACIDGQHRAITAWAAGAALVPAVAFKADVADQAVAFVGVNVNRTAVASIDKFRARVAAGDEAAVITQEIMNELGISADVPAGSALAPHQTRAVGKIEKLVKMIGRGLTFTSLEMLRDAQPEEPNLLTAFAVEASGMAVAKLVDAEADLDRLEKILADIDFDSLRDDCKQLVKLQGGQLARHGTACIIRLYNKGLRDKVAA
ncbi:DUF6551 family protein [Phaeobacter sp. S60]|uniref:DUF6551 family protein n=1 Tax=Phaeobacter sp. S60 TaxID=1569353 RepID=UPI00058D7ECC|nr:DUF6551 family protein [Phaeobacter sp. S60]KII11388.1 hypothetical protein OO25_21320 [Phaeobacter sp. S60]